MSSTHRTWYKSKYKYVSGLSIGQDKPIRWAFQFIHPINGRTTKTFETERQAAIAADRYLLENGFKAVNILKAI